MRRRQVLAAPAVLVLPSAAGAQAAWPTRPIRLIVPSAAGSPGDLITRAVSAKLAPSLGQPVPVENRPGAGGTIGADLVARAPPDGYTLGNSFHGPYAIGPAIYPALPYDPLRDFTHIALFAESYTILAVAANGPYRELPGFLAAARARPGTLRVGTAGNGTAAHVSLEMLRRLTGAETLHVPFRSGAPAAILDTIAGRIEATAGSAAAFIGNDRLRIIGVMAEQRLAAFPGAPTFREQGVDLVAATWFGLCGPAGLPAPIADRLHREAAVALAGATELALLERLGAVPARPMSRADVTAFVAAEAQRWGEAARAAGVRAE